MELRAKSGVRRAWRSFRLFLEIGVSLVELIYPAARFHSLLLARVERMALGANVDFKNVALLGGSGDELGAAHTHLTS